MSARRRLGGDHGAVLLEAALALPILLTLFLGLFEFSNVELQQSQATSAARDGARTGIVAPGDTAAIEAAVRARLTGREDVAITVTCTSAEGSPLDDCADAEYGDEMEVEVEWDYSPIGFFGGTVTPSTITGRSTMQVVGQPVSTTVTTTTSTSTSSTSTSTSSTSTTAPGPQCALQATPTATSGVRANGNSGRIDEALTIGNIQVNGVSSCGAPTLRIWPAGGYPDAARAIDVALSQSGQTWSVTFPKGDDRGWQSGTVPFEVRNGAAVLGSFSFTLS